LSDATSAHAGKLVRGNFNSIFRLTPTRAIDQFEACLPFNPLIAARGQNDATFNLDITRSAKSDTPGQLRHTAWNTAAILKTASVNVSKFRLNCFNYR
jgi:hypothetical protein